MKIVKNTAYTVSSKYDIEFEKLSDLTEIKNFKDGEDLYVINLDSKTITTGVFEKTSTDNFNNVIDKDLLDKIIENPEKIEEFRMNFTPQQPVYLVKKEFLPLFVEYGTRNVGQLLDNETKDLHIYSFISHDIIADSNNEEYMFIQYIKSQNHDQTYIDNTGKKYMEPYILDYCMANLSNGDYDLDDLVEHLSQRDDIAFVIEGKKYHEHLLLKAPLNGNEKGIDKIIEDIPHYNADEERNECITIVYYPKDEHIDKILNWNQKDPENDKKGIYSIQSFIVKEILGGIKFAKNLPEPVKEESIPKRKFKR